MSPATLPRALWCSLAAAFACNATPSEDDPFGRGIPPAGATTGSSASEDDDGGVDGAADGGSDGGVKLDVGQPDTAGDAGDGGDEGCEKVDFLFVIDASPSMEAEQT